MGPIEQLRRAERFLALAEKVPSTSEIHSDALVAAISAAVAFFELVKYQCDQYVPIPPEDFTEWFSGFDELQILRDVRAHDFHRHYVELKDDLPGVQSFTMMGPVRAKVTGPGSSAGIAGGVIFRARNASVKSNRGLSFQGCVIVDIDTGQTFHALDALRTVIQGAYIFWNNLVATHPKLDYDAPLRKG